MITLKRYGEDYKFKSNAFFFSQLSADWQDSTKIWHMAPNSIIPGSLIKGGKNVLRLPITALPDYGAPHTGLLITHLSSPSLGSSTYGITDYSSELSITRELYIRDY
jgi:hypothetical protein